MKMLLKNVVVLMAAIGFAGVASAQDATGTEPPAPTGQPAQALGIETIVVAPVKLTESLQTANATEGRTTQMRRVAEGLDSQLRAALSGTRKFRVVVGEDLKAVLDKQKRGQSGLYKSDDASGPQIGQMTPPKYVIVPTIDDFQDVAEQLISEGAEPLASARRMRLSLVLTVTDINTGEEKETANIQIEDRQAQVQKANVGVTGDQKDALLLITTRRAAEQAANRVIDVIFPAKVIAKTDKTVTINRGDGTFVAVGQVWDAFALGGKLTDPDTGEVLGNEEVAAGKVRITSVQPKFSKAEVIEDLGIDKGHVLRLHEEKVKDEAGEKRGTE